MKQSIKISIIVFTAIAIVALLFYFTKRIERAEEIMIRPQSFQKYIENRVDKDIKGKPYKEAKIAFYDLMEEIQTEAFVWLNDSTRALTDENAMKCRKMAFYSYAPIFSNYGNSYFEQQSWTIKEADAIRDEANALRAYNFAENGTSLSEDLGIIVKIVTEYHEAIAVVNSASQCGTVDAANKVIANAKKYKHDPLTNNKKLQTELNNVPNVAKESLANKLIANASNIINKKCDYADYPKWYEAYTNMVSAIEKYENAFGNNAKLTAKKTQLDQADEDALNCYD